ncbi:MAG: tetratricopeptide repeat protein [Candidatus Micrarchaeota archaeon]|nr:tetratricopeptide repeat protein [Candidatus Micrarchaeota archaeon]
MPLSKEEVAKINEFMSQKQITQLLKYVNELLLVRKDEELYNIKGIALMQLSNYSEAEKEFMNALKIKDDPVYLANCADACIMLKKYKKAERLLFQSRKKDKRNLHVYNVFIKLYVQQKKYEKALNIIDEAINHMPDNIDLLKKKEYLSHLLLTYQKLLNLHLTFVDQAQKEMQQNNYSVAIELCKTSLRLKESKEAYNTLGICYVHKNKLKKALECFKKSYAMDNKFYDALRNVASCYLDLNDIDNSLINYDKLINLDKNHRWYYERSFVHMKLRNFKKALADIQEALKKDPENSEYLTRKAEIEFFLNDLVASSNTLKKALEINPMNREAKKLLKELENASNFLMFR